ncbi:MAG: hypothetical protein NVSMB57_01700 [Actinomycetota bacterium]
MKRSLSTVALAVLLASAIAIPAHAARRVSIAADPTSGVWGTTFIFRGFTDAGVPVKLQRRFIGQSGWRDVAGRSKRADERGYFFFDDQPYASAHYRAVTTDDGSASPEARVNIHVGVSIDASRSGDHGLFSGRVLPAHVGTRVILQELDGVRHVWNNVARGSLDRSSRYRIPLRGPRNGKRIYRVAWPSQDRNHQSGLSAELQVTWVRG